MARTTRSAVTFSSRVATPSYTAADNANGESFANDGSSVYLLHVKCTGGSPCTVTITRNYTVDGAAVPNMTASVPATTGDKLIGPFPPGFFAQSDGTVYVDYSTGTGVTACLFKFTNA